MNARGTLTLLLRLVVCACTLSMLVTSSSSAASGHRLQAYLAEHSPPPGAAHRPITLANGRVHGVVYRRDSLPARLVKADCSSSCVGPVFYLGGPVLHDPKAYAIFWEPAGTKFPTGYEPVIEGFMRAVELSGSEELDNVFSVDLLYGDKTEAGGYGWKFAGALKDTDALPPRDTARCPEATTEEVAKEKNGGFGLPPSGEPCITDEQLQTELKSFMAKEGLQPGLGDLYFVFTPPTVNSCAGGEDASAECTTNSYCAYHYDVASTSPHVVYANMPWGDRLGCETPDQPNESAADDEINLMSHEGNEAITDPLGGEEGEETIGWLAYSGNEVADLCTTPFFDPGFDLNEELDAYGHLLGGKEATYNSAFELLTIGNAYNQVIDGGHYLLQREWSDAAKGCVARAPVPTASFSMYSNPATVGGTVSFNGAASSPSAGTIESYRWEFGDGTTGTGEVAEHVYTSTGEFVVRLEVTNNSGASAVDYQAITVKKTPTPEKEVTTVTTTVTTPAPIRLPSEVAATKEPTSPRAWTASQLAGLIGLPANGAKLSGLGAISFGHAQCPPACVVTLKLTATVASGKGRHRNVTTEQIGYLRMKILDKKTGSLSLQLNAAGRALLRKSHTLAAKLAVAVQGQEGGTWSMERTLRLTSSASAARRHRSHAASRRRS